jgi:hypothetical protein
MGILAKKGISANFGMKIVQDVDRFHLDYVLNRLASSHIVNNMCFVKTRVNIVNIVNHMCCASPMMTMA